MCNRKTSLTDPTADFVLSDLLTATEDLIDFSINVFDTIRLQSHFNDRNRRTSLGMQLKDVSDAQKSEFGFVDIPIKPCRVTTTLKYDLTLYLDRILQACKRTKTNLMFLRISRARSTNTTLLVVASTHVRVEQLNKKVQLLSRLVKENGGEFPTKKKKKKKVLSNTKLEENTEPKQEKEKKPSLNVISKEDLNDYTEIAHSFRTIISKYREFIQQIRNATKSNGQASVTNSIVLVPIAANAIQELNNILNRLIRIAFTIEAESNYLRQPPPIDNKELYQQNSKDLPTSHNQILLTERVGSLEEDVSKKEAIPYEYSDFKQNETRSNIRNQSAISSPSTMNSFKLTSNMIANIFEDFFLDSNHLFD